MLPVTGLNRNTPPEVSPTTKRVPELFGKSILIALSKRNSVPKEIEMIKNGYENDKMVNNDGRGRGREREEESGREEER